MSQFFYEMGPLIKDRINVELPKIAHVIYITPSSNILKDQKLLLSFIASNSSKIKLPVRNHVFLDRTNDLTCRPNGRYKYVNK